MQGLSHLTDEQTSSAIAIKIVPFLHAPERKKQNLVLNANLRKRIVLGERK